MGLRDCCTRRVGQSSNCGSYPHKNKRSSRIVLLNKGTMCCNPVHVSPRIDPDSFRNLFCESSWPSIYNMKKFDSTVNEFFGPLDNQIGRVTCRFIETAGGNCSTHSTVRKLHFYVNQTSFAVQPESAFQISIPHLKKETPVRCALRHWSRMIGSFAIRGQLKVVTV